MAILIQEYGFDYFIFFYLETNSKSSHETVAASPYVRLWVRWKDRSSAQQKKKREVLNNSKDFFRQRNEG